MAKKPKKISCERCGNKYDPLRYQTGCPICSAVQLQQVIKSIRHK